ncbi:hypothetical protein SASPL_112012 [Salvia splendens]|uniref:Altered inheritance of mitochondria protein 24, mitochondrial n=1 Tax=Salvia splendens TaxID=180675 RepID=A0A8X8Y964_SALSN|nr:hypothetical protein SASPL_112012 [Salvia splendens]
MAAPFFSTPFQPFVYQSPQDAVTPFQILGGEAQIVQVMLKPQEKVIAKPGHCFTGTSGLTFFLIYNPIQIDLALFGGEMLCQPDAFLCSINDVKVNNTVDQRARNVITSAEGFLRQRISGQGLAFIVGGGSVVQKNLEVGEVLAVDVSSIVAVSASVNLQIKYNGPMRRVLFGGDNMVTAIITGPGIVFIQSMPFHRLSQRIARAVTSPNMRDNPKFFFQIVIFFFLAYVVVVSSLILTDI